MGPAKPRPFKTGKLIVTDAIVNAMEDEVFKAFVYASYIRYCANDWGDLEKCDSKLNKRNLKHGGNLGGRYINQEHNWEIWILTTASRDRTIISMANEGQPYKTLDEREEEQRKMDRVAGMYNNEDEE